MIHEIVIRKLFLKYLDKKTNDNIIYGQKSNKSVEKIS